MRARSISFATAGVLMASTPLIAQSTEQALVDPDATAQGDVAVTIYNNGTSLVQDVRQLDIATGRSRIEFPDVSAQIRAETLSFAAAGAGNHEATVSGNRDPDGGFAALFAQ